MKITAVTGPYTSTGTMNGKYYTHEVLNTDFTVDTSRTRLTVSGGGTATVSCNADGAPVAVDAASIDEYFKIGTVLNITLNLPAGNELWHIIDKESNKIISKSASFSYTVTSVPSQLEAVVIVESIAQEHYISFEDFNGVVVLSRSAAHNEIVTPPPIASMLYGFNFHGWSRDMALPVTENTVVKALYTKDEQEYTVYIKRSDSSCDAIHSLRFDDAVTATVLPADIPAGKHFAGWSFDGVTPVCFTESFTFYVSGNMTVTALFSDTAPVKEPKIYGFRVAETADGVSFMSVRRITTGSIFVETGMLFTKEALGGSDTSFVISAVNGTTVKRLRSETSLADSQFLLSVKSAEGKIYARPYLIYKAANGEIVTLYGEILWGLVGGSETSSSQLDQQGGNI